MAGEDTLLETLIECSSSGRRALVTNGAAQGTGIPNTYPVQNVFQFIKGKPIRPEKIAVRLSVLKLLIYTAGQVITFFRGF